MYLIVVRATDASGNGATACCAVVVPHSNTAKMVAAAEAKGAAAQATWTATGSPPAGYTRVLVPTSLP